MAGWYFDKITLTHSEWSFYQGGGGQAVMEPGEMRLTLGPATSGGGEERERERGLASWQAGKLAGPTEG